ncbi:MAG: hypothetical protein L3J54_11515 [Draconibacterium sp.]|nr:hypothetical protein [Draconibacterium sp.]
MSFTCVYAPGDGFIESFNIGFTKADQYPALRFGVGASASGLAGNNSSNFYAYPELSWEIGFGGNTDG